MRRKIRMANLNILCLASFSLGKPGHLYASPVPMQFDRWKDHSLVVGTVKVLKCAMSHNNGNVPF